MSLRSILANRSNSKAAFIPKEKKPSATFSLEGAQEVILPGPRETEVEGYALPIDGQLTLTIPMSELMADGNIRADKNGNAHFNANASISPLCIDVDGAKTPVRMTGNVMLFTSIPADELLAASEAEQDETTNVSQPNPQSN